MPWRIRKMDGKFQVVDYKDKVYGTHPSRKDAEKQLAALWASEKGKK